MIDIKKDIGNKIRAERKKKGWSQKYLGDTVGSNREHISKVENGKVNSSLDYIAKIAEALKIKFKFIVKKP